MMLYCYNMCMCVCVCVRERGGEQRERESIKLMYDNFYLHQIMLVVELMHKGNLKDYLPTLRPRYEAH